MKKVILYACASPRKGDRAIIEQLDLCAQYAHALELEIAVTLWEQSEQQHHQRKQFRRVLEYANHYPKVMVHSMEDITHDPREQWNVKQQLRRKGVELIEVKHK